LNAAISVSAIRYLLTPTNFTDENAGIAVGTGQTDVIVIGLAAAD